MKKKKTKEKKEKGNDQRDLDGTWQPEPARHRSVECTNQSNKVRENKAEKRKKVKKTKKKEMMMKNEDWIEIININKW